MEANNFKTFEYDPAKPPVPPVTNNTITVGGRVQSDFVFSHEIYGESFYRFNIEVPRLSGQADVLPVTVSDRVLDKSQIGIGRHVKIQGQVRSYNTYVEAENKNKLVLTIFARDIVIEEAPSDSPNEVVLEGYLCKPAIYRTTPFGREICDMLFAVNRSYNKSDYIPCIAWGRNARYAGKLNVGDHMRIWGRMQSRQYQKKYDDGATIVEKTAYELSVSKIDLLAAKDKMPPTAEAEAE
jgi:hypothetical protein